MNKKINNKNLFFLLCLFNLFLLNSFNNDFLFLRSLLKSFLKVITETNIIDDVEDELMQIEAEPLANQTRFRYVLKSIMFYSGP